jgi:NADH-quinone oxidoreductase subunit A
MTDLVFYLVVFLAVGVFFLFIHLMIGKLIRPYRPDPEKMTIYECGEPTVGSAWIQFDLRYYVVALLFVVFDVEVAFFFPWAVVFGKANELSKPDSALTAPRDRKAITEELAPTALNLAYFENVKKTASEDQTVPKKEAAKGQGGLAKGGKKGGAKKEPGPAGEGQIPGAGPPPGKGGIPAGAEAKARPKPSDVQPIDEATAKSWAWIAFLDILVFFGVLMVGFAYLWRRGDIDWVRSTAAEKEQ